jgi:predicted transposase YbfD/YdcC
VADKSNEITAAPRLLAGRALDGVVISMDALLTQRALATQILVQHGHYLMVVKANQRTLFTDLDRLFTGAPLIPWPSDAAETATTAGKGHGRLEERTLERTAALTGHLDWPGVGQVLRRTCRRVILATGEIQEETNYGVTSLPVEAAAAAEVPVCYCGVRQGSSRV